tara:strand:+ start:765 stop:986 length:222 start_codon:yes stop_codon:yes gene_type:complete
MVVCGSGSGVVYDSGIVCIIGVICGTGMIYVRIVQVIIVQIWARHISVVSTMIMLSGISARVCRKCGPINIIV